MAKTAKQSKAKEPKICTTGRRKTAIARVYLSSGQGKITINKQPIEKYFDRETSCMLVRQPLEATDSLTKFNIIVKVQGGGSSGQAGAIRLGIARALVKLDEEQAAAKTGGEITIVVGEEAGREPLTVRKTLRKLKLLTRDPRVVERKKVGLHKARKRPQYSKR